MVTSEQALREAVVEVCRRAYLRGFIMSGDGNVSVRLNKNKILITPSGVNKGFLSPDDIVAVEMSGRKSGRQTPSSEFPMHLRVYMAREDAIAAIHAHPPYCTALSIAGIPINANILPESVITLCGIPTAPYAVPGGEELAQSINEAIKEYNAVVLEQHGVITVGPDLFSAYDTLERIEHVAKVQYLSRQLGAARELPPGEIAKLAGIAEKRGYRKKKS